MDPKAVQELKDERARKLAYVRREMERPETATSMAVTDDLIRALIDARSICMVLRAIGEE